MDNPIPENPVELWEEVTRKYKTARQVSSGEGKKVDDYLEKEGVR